MDSGNQADVELELFRTLFDNSTDSLLVVDPATASFLDVNETACRRHNYSREEFLQLTVPDIETEIPDPTAWESYVEELKAAGELTFDGSHRRKDGSTYPVEVNASYIELDQDYIVAIARDVTERRQRQQELEQYRAFTQAANDVIVTIDSESIIQSINPAASDLFDYDAAELIGKSLTVLMPDRFVDAHREGITRYLESGEKNIDWGYVELPGRHADGSEIPLAITFGKGHFDGNQFFTGIMRDISERKEIERELEESNERLEQFAYAASHDLQEPLRMVSSYLQLIEHRYGNELDEDGQEFLEFAVDGAERMKAMIDGLLEYARVETEAEPFSPVDLEALLEDVLTDLQFRIEESNAEVTWDPLPTVRGDADQLRQVFQNLLDNAIEYSGDAPPQVHITADSRRSKWLISVSDEGVGIDPDQQDRIFDVFQRLHTSEEHAGTGIGLALCQRIIERHDGEVQVESEPGEGTTFSFTLPATQGGP